jgi:hypothetical protein
MTLAEPPIMSAAFRRALHERKQRAAAYKMEHLTTYEKTATEPLLILLRTGSPAVFKLALPTIDSLLTTQQIDRSAAMLDCDRADMHAGSFVWLNHIPDDITPIQRKVATAIMKSKGGYVNFETIAEPPECTVEMLSGACRTLMKRRIIRKIATPIPIRLVSAGQSDFFACSNPLPLLFAKKYQKDTVTSQASTLESTLDEKPPVTVAIRYEDTWRLLDVKSWTLGATVHIPEDDRYRMRHSPSEHKQYSGPLRDTFSRERSQRVAGYAYFVIGDATEIETLLHTLRAIGKWAARWGPGGIRSFEVQRMGESSGKVYPFFLRFGDVAVLHRHVPLRYLGPPEYNYIYYEQADLPVRGPQYMRSPRVEFPCATAGSTLPFRDAIRRLKTPFKTSPEK